MPLPSPPSSSRKNTCMHSFSVQSKSLMGAELLDFHKFSYIFLLFSFVCLFESTTSTNTDTLNINTNCQFRAVWSIRCIGIDLIITLDTNTKTCEHRNWVHIELSRFCIYRIETHVCQISILFLWCVHLIRLYSLCQQTWHPKPIGDANWNLLEWFHWAFSEQRKWFVLGRIDTVNARSNSV